MCGGASVRQGRLRQAHGEALRVRHVSYVRPFDFPPELRPTISRLYNVILERALLRAYQNLDEETKGRMTQIFTSGTTEEKNKFILTKLKH